MSFLKVSPGRQGTGPSFLGWCQLKGLGFPFGILPLLGLDPLGTMFFPFLTLPCLAWHSYVDQACLKLVMRILPQFPDR